MKCPSCSCDNLPIRETSSMVGSKICIPSHCAQCGHALTEKCPVCTYNHAIGTKFCQADGTNLVEWAREERVWKRLVQTMEATLTVRPDKAVLSVLLFALPGLYFVGGWWLKELTRHHHDFGAGEGFYAGILLALFLTFLATVFPMAIPINIMMSIEKSRRQELFEDQKYKSLKPTDDVINTVAS